MPHGGRNTGRSPRRHLCPRTSPIPRHQLAAVDNRRRARRTASSTSSREPHCHRHRHRHRRWRRAPSSCALVVPVSGGELAMARGDAWSHARCHRCVDAVAGIGGQITSGSRRRRRATDYVVVRPGDPWANRRAGLNTGWTTSPAEPFRPSARRKQCRSSYGQDDALGDRYDGSNRHGRRGRHVTSDPVAVRTARHPFRGLGDRIWENHNPAVAGRADLLDGIAKSIPACRAARARTSSSGHRLLGVGEPFD